MASKAKDFSALAVLNRLHASGGGLGKCETAVTSLQNGVTFSAKKLPAVGEFRPSVIETFREANEARGTLKVATDTVAVRINVVGTGEGAATEIEAAWKVNGRATDQSGETVEPVNRIKETANGSK